MGKPSESALERAYEDGLERGIELAEERLRAFFEIYGGEPPEVIIDIFVGRLTADMMAPQREQQRERIH